MDEWEGKIESLALSTIEENVTSIAGVPTWTMVLIKRILEMSDKVGGVNGMRNARIAKDMPLKR